MFTLGRTTRLFSDSPYNSKFDIQNKSYKIVPLTNEQTNAILCPLGKLGSPLGRPGILSEGSEVENVTAEKLNSGALATGVVSRKSVTRSSSGEKDFPVFFNTNQNNNSDTGLLAASVSAPDLFNSTAHTLRRKSMSAEEKAPVAGMILSVPPLSRTQLKPQPEKPSKSWMLLPRQMGQPMDAVHISPLIQEVLQAPNPNFGRGTQNLSRIIPVSWCLTGGTETHRRHEISKELHVKMLKEGKKVIVDARNDSIRSQKERYGNLSLEFLSFHCTPCLTNSLFLLFRKMDSH